MAEINGRVSVPGSKSIALRAVLAAALSPSTSFLRNVNLCDDTLAMLDAVHTLGAGVDARGSTVSVTGPLGVNSDIDITCGESGSCERMLAPVAARFAHRVVLRGTGSLAGRPMGMLRPPLEALGAGFSGERGERVEVHGPMHGGEIGVDGSMTSQHISGLLMALPLLDGTSVLHVEDAVSTPYLDLTLQVMERAGVTVGQEKDGTAAPEGGGVKGQNGNTRIYRIPGGQRYGPLDMTVEGDWSAAAFLLVAGAVGGSVHLAGLEPDSLQSDRAVVDVLRSAGARVELHDGIISCHRGLIAPFIHDASDTPDLVPPLVLLGLFATGTSRITGIRRLRHKESNRAGALARELGRIGGRVEVRGDEMLVHPSRITGGRANALGDHRTAMLLRLAGVLSGKEVEIIGQECVSKSYPGFPGDLEALEVIR